MSNSIAVDVEGFPELVQKIRELANDKDKRREVLMLLRQIARPTLAAAKLLAPVSSRPHKARGRLIQPGNLKKSLGLITGKNKENPTILVGARAKGQFLGYYAHFVHEGVNSYQTGFKRKRTKGANMKAAVSRSQGYPFLRKAYEQTQAAATADSEKKMSAFIQRRINKLGL